MNQFNNASGMGPAVLVLVALTVAFIAALAVQLKNAKRGVEKRCRQCGEAMAIGAETCQGCGVPQGEAVSRDLGGQGNKFLYATVASLLAYLVLEHRFLQEWTSAAILIGIGSALMGGVAARLMPATRKRIYLPIAILVMIGVSNVLNTGLFFYVMTLTSS
ncbi:MAG: hypothetical protein FIB06_00505 [Betaproteobacteria bacterium]|nr:hypothetical protein [Betaproteobacteria bacterium]